jgi:hypothetical protein
MYESDFTKLKEALKEYKKSGMFEFNKRAVEAFGFRAVGVPGYFDWRSLGVSGQFLNGLLLEDRETKKRFLITNSATTGLTSLKPEKGNMLHSWNETHLLHELAAVFSREMKKHDIDVVYVNTENARGGGLHCLSKEERDDWSGALHAIPVKSQALPATVSTILQIEDMRQNSRTKEPIELCIKTSPDSDADTRTQAVLFDQWSPTSWSCKQNVPIDKPLIVFLKIGNKKTQEYSFLPGHPLLLSVFSPSST